MAGGRRPPLRWRTQQATSGFSWPWRWQSVFIEGFAAQFDETRREAIQKGERLATEQERRRHQRIIHDSLEAMAAGRVGDEAALRARARWEAGALRSLLGERPAASGLRAALEDLAWEMQAGEGIRIEVNAEEAAPEPEPQVAEALLGAAREALVNVAKHADVRRATVRLRAAEDGIELVVRDEGKGFDVVATGAGFGTTESIRARLADVGGRGLISSQPGQGTRVQLWAPLP